MSEAVIDHPVATVAVGVAVLHWSEPADTGEVPVQRTQNQTGFPFRESASKSLYFAVLTEKVAVAIGELTHLRHERWHESIGRWIARGEWRDTQLELARNADTASFQNDDE
ncbi:MAG: hypothetical protein O3B13_13730 [Planctomycetota bacterium]|nr:hypothetical protein [Planctomycetota bacterium]MDA1164161.1 hypothetical protein [Planctomycetota bacterium]